MMAYKTIKTNTGYDELVRLASNYAKIPVEYEHKIILKDIIFMLTDLKEHKSLKIYSVTERRDLYKMMYSMFDRYGKPVKLWQCGAYFRLKNLYLDWRAES